MAAWFAVGAALAATGVLAEKPARKARAAVGSTRSEYAIAQQGREMGSESILRTDYNDNTVVFGVHSRLEPAPETVMDQNVEFTVVEESFYPLGYRMAKRIDQGDSGITMEISIDMFANVAVMTSKSANAEGTSRIVLPTGAAFVETGTIYAYEQFLFWYDRRLGGRQNFDAMDVANGKEESLVVQLIAADTVSVGGEATPVDVYKLHRPYFEVTLYVDGAGRMVRAEQNFMTWDLKEWSHEAVKAQ
jgi:hypothetical protein